MGLVFLKIEPKGHTMPLVKNTALALLLLSGSLVSAASAETPLPDAIAAPGETIVLTVHAEGAQVYECKAGNDGKLAWAFREPVATLIADDKIVGRHYAGPTWELTDGSAVAGKVAARRRDGKGHRLAQARRGFPARQRHAFERHDGTAHQYNRRQARRRVRQAGGQP